MNFSLEGNQTANKEVDRLKENNMIKELHDPKWLANVVVVKKNNRKSIVCIDFTKLNKACPNDSFSLQW